VARPVPNDNSAALARFRSPGRRRWWYAAAVVLLLLASCGTRPGPSATGQATTASSPTSPNPTTRPSGLNPASPPRGDTLGRGIGGTGGRASTPTTAPGGGPATSTTGPSTAYAIQPLYVLPKDGRDHGLATNNTISNSVKAMQRWLAGQTGGRRLRFLASPVATVRVTKTDAQIAREGDFVRDQVEKLLKHKGYSDPHRIYAVWYDGTSTTSCGGGAWPPELIGHVAALYLRGRYTTSDGTLVDCSQNRFSSDGVTPKFNDYSMLHEIVHTLGFVAYHDHAPHHTQCGHASDSPTDLMYAGPANWDPRVLDVGHDDYYLTGRTPDLSRSVFLEPLPPRPMPPPGWSGEPPPARRCPR
jgi:hypothetical protein